MDNTVCMLCITFVIYIIAAERSVTCSYVPHIISLRRNQEAQNTPRDLVAEAEQRAEAGILNGKITLNLEQRSGSQNIVSQFTVGETVALACTPETQSGDTATDYIWKHNNKIIHTDRRSGKFRYTVNNVDSTYFLYIHNITFYDAGTIECYKRCGNETDEFCFRKDYILRPKARTVQDVFVEPLKDVSVPISTKSSFTCAAKFWCVPDSDPFFIWKYNGLFVSVPRGHPLVRLRQPRRSGIGMVMASNFSKPNEEIPYCQETLTLTISLTSHNGGTVECWVRSDIYSNEWFVQKGNLQFQ